MTEKEALRDIKMLAKIAMRTDDPGQVRISLDHIAEVIQKARSASFERLPTADGV